MDCNEYQTQARRTEADPSTPRLRITGLYQQDSPSVFQPTRLIHALMGLVTEVGELADVLKKHFFYGKPLDGDHCDEEVGDLLWYVALYCNARGVRLGDLLAANNAKLRARYPDKFTEEKAMVRDLKQEQDALRSVPDDVGRRFLGVVSDPDVEHARLSDDGNPHDPVEPPRCDQCGGKLAGPACPHCDCEYA